MDTAKLLFRKDILFKQAVGIYSLFIIDFSSMDAA